MAIQTVERLSIYRRALEELHNEAVEYIFSHELAQIVGVTPTQLRKDLSSFGSFGSGAKGYNVRELIGVITRLLGTDRLHNVALIGVGNLGKTLLSYRGFAPRGFRVSVVFDVDPVKVGRIFAGRRCYHIDSMDEVLAKYSIDIAILACAPDNLQEVVDQLAEGGVRAILNFVPTRVTPPPNVHIEEIDVSAKLEKLAYLVSTQELCPPDEPED